MIGRLFSKNPEHELVHDTSVEEKAMGSLERFERALCDLERLLKSENKKDDVSMAAGSHRQSRSSS